MRFIRGCLMGACYILVFLGSARALTIGQTAVLSAPDNGNGNTLLAQSANLAQAATIQSLSFYVTSASGNLVLGIYDATGPDGGPGTLKASTASFTPTTGWNTANVTQPVSLAAGTYWLAYLPSSDNLSFVKTNGSGNCAYFTYNFGGMPSTFSASPAGCTPTTWSFYATLAVATTTGSSPSGSTPASGSTQFVALHTYYMSPTGSDRNNGLTAATPWATPNHPVLCGDVIIAAPGAYSTGQFATKYTQPSNCPSTTGGRADFPGGVYFAVLLCGGADLMACKITTTGSGDPAALVDFNVCCNDTSGAIPAHNWAIEGFNIDAGDTTPKTGSECCRAIEAGRACADAAVRTNDHIAVINNIISNTRQAWVGIADCGDVGPAIGFDYAAIVGNIVQNSVQENSGGFVCIAAIDMIGMRNLDSVAGTHLLVYNNFGMNNRNTTCASLYDGEFMMMDSPGQHSFTNQIVWSNNMGFQSTRACLQLTNDNRLITSGLIAKAYNNTCYGNNIDGNANGSGDEFGGELNMSGSNTNTAQNWVIQITNNIMQPAKGTASNGTRLYATFPGGNPWPNFEEGAEAGAGLQNVFYSLNNTKCDFDCGPSAFTPPFVESYSNPPPSPSATANTYTKSFLQQHR